MAVKGKRRNTIKIIYDVLKMLVYNKSTKSRINYNMHIRYKRLKRYLYALNKYGFIIIRNANEDELRVDKRSRKYIEITDKGREFLSDLEELNKKYDGVLLGEKKWIK